MSNRIFLVFCWSIFLAVLVAFFFVCGDILFTGLQKIDLNFIFASYSDAGRAGGIFPIIVSTLVIVGIALTISTFMSAMTAITVDFLQKRTYLHQCMKLLLDTLNATPSIVFGLVGNLLFCEVLGFGYSLLSGGLTLALMIFPLQTRILLMGLNSFPKELFYATQSLNLSHFTLYFKIKIRTIKSQIFTGALLGLGRSLAETAALLFTSGYGVKLPSSLLDSGRSISIHIYDLAMNVSGGDINAYKSAFVLIVLVLIISLISTSIQNEYEQKEGVLRWNH